MLLLLSYLTVVFFVSGLVINFLQLLSLILVWPISHAAYRRLNGFLVTFFWTEVLWLAEWWANIRLRVFCEPGVAEKIGKEKALVLCNHLSDLDWLFGWMIAHNYDILGGAKCLLKQVLMFVPVLGWSWWFLEYVFLHRTWEKDKGHLSTSFRRLGDFPMPFWVVIFAEGTRFTQEKHQKSVEFCKEKGLPVFNNVLYPRTKGWKLVATELRDSVDCVYDCCFTFPPNKIPGLGDLLNGVRQDVFVHVRRHPIATVPADDAGADKFCIESYRRMDNLLDTFNKDGKFPDVEHEQKRRLLPLAVMIFWSVVVSGLFAYFLLPPILAGEFFTLWLLLGLLAVGELFLRLFVWFSKKRVPKPKKTAKAE